MTREMAEDVWMAWQLGYETDKGKIATAILVLDDGDFFDDDENPSATEAIDGKRD